MFGDALNYPLIDYDILEIWNAVASFGLILKLDMIALEYTHKPKENAL